LSLAIQGSRLAASRIAPRSQQQLQLIDNPVANWIGGQDAINTTNATSSTTITSRGKLDINGTLQSVGLNILSGSPTVGRVYCTIILESSEQDFLTTLARGYIYPGHSPWGAGGIGIKFGDKIRLETRSSIGNVVIRPTATILRDVYQPAGWTGTDKGSTEGPGRVRTITTSDPAATVDIDETVPAGRQWQVFFCLINFTTDSNAGSREVFLAYTDGSNTIWRNDAWGTAASTSTVFEFYGSEVADSDASGQIRQQQIPNKILPAGYHIKTITGNLKAGDDFQASSIHVEEHIAP